MLTIGFVLFASSYALAQNTCPAAVPNDGVDDAPALQNCLNGGGNIALPFGVYTLAAHGLTITQPSTWFHSLGQRAILQAAPSLQAKMLVAVANSFTLSDLEFDGNRLGRAGNRDFLCNPNNFGGQRPANIDIAASFYTIHHVVSKNALCGAGMGLRGVGYNVYENIVHDNGWEAGVYPPGVEPWSDGITALDCQNGTIANNLIANNTDLDLVVGGGPNCMVTGNTIIHDTRYGFGGLSIGNFADAGVNRGNHNGSVFSGNSVSSGLNLLSIGILIGAHPWDTNPIYDVSNAGLVTNNSSSGSVINMLLEGFASGAVYGNTIGASQGTRGMTCTVSAPIAGWHFPWSSVQGPVVGLENDLATSGNPCVPQGVVSPQISISSPPHGATFPAGSTITVTSSASDPDGTVTRVDYYANGGYVGSAFAAPWSLSAPNVAAGTYVVHSVAIDNHGLSSRSRPHTIFVQ
ncbi:MAG TPA: Ig-like domain-containing protein [Vicinamibacterales bacterium]|nr:Ig-like domain-containing protein [Vicinamibacterales bacterium]